MSFVIYAQLTPQPKPFAAGVHVCASEAVARAAGHTVINHPRGKKYEEVVMPDTLTPSSIIGRVSVRNHTVDELSFIRGVLDRLPQALLDRFAAQYTGIVCVDWSGSDWRDATRPNSSTLLSGGANMERSITRGSITESGRRIELTHSAMYERRNPPYHRRGVFTLWHELGHVAYRNRFTPRNVERSDYGESIHVGAEEQPAYAFMWYFLNPSKLTNADRSAFDLIFGRTASGTSAVGSASAAATVIPNGRGSRVRNSTQMIPRWAALSPPIDPEASSVSQTRFRQPGPLV